VRTPARVTQQTALIYAVITLFWATYHLLELNPILADYHAQLLPKLTYASIFVGRMGTLGIFFVRYTVRLFLRPGEYVGLRQPVRVSYGGGAALVDGDDGHGHLQAAGGETGTGTGKAGQAVSLGGGEGTLLHALSPALAARAVEWARLPMVDGAVTLCLGLGLAATVAALMSQGGRWPGYASVLLLGPALQALAVLDPAVLRLLCQYFNFWYLLGNAALAFIYPLVAFKGNAGPVLAALMLFTTSTMVVAADALRLPYHSKLRNAAGFMLAMLAGFVTYCAGYTSEMDLDQQLIAHVSTVTFMWVGRLFTLGLYFLKFAVHLVRRPRAFMIINKPLRPEDTTHRLATTLSSMVCDMQTAGGLEGGASTQLV
jgi:hypothetical protein